MAWITWINYCFPSFFVSISILQSGIHTDVLRSIVRSIDWLIDWISLTTNQWINPEISPWYWLHFTSDTRISVLLNKNSHFMVSGIERVCSFMRTLWSRRKSGAGLKATLFAACSFESDEKILRKTVRWFSGNPLAPTCFKYCKKYARKQFWLSVSQEISTKWSAAMISSNPSKAASGLGNSRDSSSAASLSSRKCKWRQHKSAQHSSPSSWANIEHILRPNGISTWTGQLVSMKIFNISVVLLRIRTFSSRFLGWRSNTQQLFNTSKICLFPVRQEQVDGGAMSSVANPTV